MIMKKYMWIFSILLIPMGIGAVQNKTVEAADAASAEATFYVS
jgi:hypothetical protein